jgi:2-hydroxychromene-2-carboxylate isomerase
MKERVEANTAEAIGRGVFGVPTVDTGEKLYFGNDRLEMLERNLATRQ